jgi:hypothetical protein
MGNLWYPLALLMDGEMVYMLWMGDDWAKDLVLVDDGRVITFHNAKSAQEFATGAGLQLAPGGADSPP